MLCLFIGKSNVFFFSFKGQIANYFECVRVLADAVDFNQKKIDVRILLEMLRRFPLPVGAGYSCEIDANHTNPLLDRLDRDCSTFYSRYILSYCLEKRRAVLRGTRGDG